MFAICYLKLQPKNIILLVSKNQSSTLSLFITCSWLGGLAVNNIHLSAKLCCWTEIKLIDGSLLEQCI